VKFNSNAGTPATPANAASAKLSIKLSGDAQVFLNSDQDLASLRVDFTEPGNQSFDLASPGAPGQFRSVRVYASDLASAKKSIYGAIITANAAGAPSFTDGIYDSGLVTHFGMKLGMSQLVDAHGDNYILIRPTRAGDLNFDGVVTISDFIDLASNFNGSYAGSLGPISAEDQQLLASFASSVGV